MEKALTFNSVQLDVIPQNSEPWVRGYQIGTALGYSEPSLAIRKIYTAHADEFSDSMTKVVKLPTEGGEQDVRIFSLRGCHLLAMFARTPVAKDFRKWVLDVLDRIAAEQQTTSGTITPDQQCTLQAIVKAKVEALPEDKRKGKYPQLWSRFNNHFRLAKYSQLPQVKMSEAVTYLTQLEIVAHAIEAPKPVHDDSKSDFYKCLDEYVNGFGEMVDEVHKKLTTRGNYFSMLMHLDRQARNMQLQGMDNLAVQSLHDYTYLATCGANMLLKAIDGFNRLKNACNVR